jgi:hypothetical protein
MVKKWVRDSFRQILVDHCEAYLNSKDLGWNKARTKVIKDVEDQIREAAPGHDFPPDLNKVCCHLQDLNEAQSQLNVTVHKNLVCK